MNPLDDNGIDSADACAHGDYVRDERKGEDAIRALREKLARFGADVVEIIRANPPPPPGEDYEDWCGDHMPAVYGCAKRLGLLSARTSSGLDKFRERRQGK